MIKKYLDFNPEVPDSCYIADSAELIGRVKLGENVSIWPGCTLRGDIHFIEIGENTNIQELTCIHVEFPPEADSERGCTKIGKNVTVGHRALIHGCIIEDNCLIGMGAIILNGAVIGEGSIVGAGALVKENMIVPPNSLVVGLPGVVKAQLAPEKKAIIANSAKKYVELGKLHKANQ